ncbi:MAG: LamG-like jellyroll fold domain-containing protein [Bacteroidia bacterium]
MSYKDQTGVWRRFFSIWATTDMGYAVTPVAGESVQTITGNSTAIVRADGGGNTGLGSGDHTRDYQYIKHNVGRYYGGNFNTSSPNALAQMDITCDNLSRNSVGDFDQNFHFYIINLPPEVLALGTVNIRVEESHWNNGPGTGGGQNDQNNQDYTFTIPTIAKPFGLTATNDDLCNKVRLDWTNPDQPWELTNSCTPGSIGYNTVIFRNNAFLAQVHQDSTSYTDATALPGVSYSYKIERIRWYPANYSYKSSGFITPATGKAKSPPAQATSLTATNTKCDNTIEINWDYNYDNPQSFLIKRGTALAGPYTDWGTIDPNERFFLDDSLVTRGTRYYYTLNAKDNCGSLSANSKVNGISPTNPAVATNLKLIKDSINNKFIIKWRDNATNETKYVVERIDNTGNTASYNVNVNDTIFTDDNVATCKLYKYNVRVFNDCVQTGTLAAVGVQGTLPPPNLSTTFDNSTKKLVGSKGYFNNRVELTWGNNNTSVLSSFNIYRKVLGSTLDSVQITSLASGNTFYIDNLADAGTFYKYTIVGVSNCNGTSLPSNASEDIGFRNPTGIINGHVEYDGGVAVKDVKISIERSTGSAGFALTYDGVRELSTPNTPKLSTPNSITVETWARFEQMSSAHDMIGKDFSYYLWYTGSYIQMYVSTNNGIYQAIYPKTGGAFGDINISEYNHYSGTFDATGVKLYFNGNLVATTSVPAGTTINQNANTLDIGGRGIYRMNGYLDEVRVWNLPRTNVQIKRDYERVLNGDEQGLIALYHADENNGNFAYDVSKTGTVFNAHHAQFTGTSGNVWSDTIPLPTQLGYFGYTDANGDYAITAVRYKGNGENFKVTPSLGVHTFSPSNKILFVGDGATVHNGIDFIDKSSFKTTGNIRYAQSTCPAEGAFVKIDGSVVIKNGQPVKTNALGDFDLNVPIGRHFLTVEKPGHTYSVGVWPAPDTTYDFQAPVSGIKLIDSTFVTVIGRVVGGTREAAKPMIPGRSVNNIGQANIKFESLSGCYEKTITTVDSSGDYVVHILPLKYSIPDFTTTNALSLNVATFNDNIFKNNAALDLTIIPPVQQNLDTLFTNPQHTAWSSIDSVNYQKIRSWVYRTAPNIWVQDNEKRDFVTFGGDSTYVIENEITKVKDTLNVRGSGLGYPVFTQHENYYLRIGAEEIYTDLSNGNVDKVPVTTGTFTIDNALAANSLVTLTADSGVISPKKDVAYVNYKFKGGNPSTTYNSGDPANFLHAFNINFQSGPNAVDWLPKAGNTAYKGFIVGSKSSDGQSFVSVGPQVPEMILRDPPGSNSFAAYEVGTSTTSVESWELGGGTEIALQKRIALGAKFSVGLGMVTETEVHNDLVLNAVTTTSLNKSGEVETTIETTEAWETSGDPAFVGANADVYMGKAMNVNFGIANSLSLVPDSACSKPGILCRGEILTKAGKDYHVATRKTLAVAPGGYATSFFYTQDHIVNKLIPRLKELRDQLFTAKPAVYQSNLPLGHINFGRSNDDPTFGKAPYTAFSVGCTNCPSSKDPIKTDPTDINGISYRYIAPAAPNTLTVTSTTGQTQAVTLPASMGDSIRWYNQQIRLWEDAIKLNEEEKYKAINNAALLLQNYSFSGGTTLTRTATSSRTETNATSFEVAIDANALLKISTEVGGNGIGVEQGITVNVTRSGSSATATSRSTTHAFTLADDNTGDFLSVDVFKSTKGFGNIFSIQAGETSCPYEGITKSLYYKPGNTALTIGGGTLKRALVSMKVDGNTTFSKKVNVPASGTAVFDLELFNETETNDDMDYTLNVLSASNPNGAILTVDGSDLSSNTPTVPANGSIHKQLVVAKGALGYDFDSIAVVVGSSCGDGSVGDTVYVSVHFLPTCTDVKISNPLNQWVVNNSFKDTLNVIVDGYDINNKELKNINFEIKPSSQASWIPLETWYKNIYSAGPDSLPITQSAAYTLYKWSLLGINDGAYDIRATSTCDLANNESEVYSGFVDRINPEPFGTPSPADGILDPNDDIALQFNEPIDIGGINKYNFDVRGVLNGTTLSHATSLNFDGVSNYAEVTAGAGLQKRDFTIEFWAKANATNVNQVVVSQGTDALQALNIGFDASNKLYLALGNQQAKTTSAVSNINTWRHYAVSYDYANQRADIYVDNNKENAGNESILYDYTGSGKLAIGKQLPSNTNYFNGNIHDVRVWNKQRNFGDIVSTMSTNLSRSNSGLLYNWKMTEAEGAFAADDIRSRNANIYGATWQVNPNGSAMQFDGVDDNIKIQSGKIALTKEMDFTLEFWYNSSQAAPATLFSNGKGDGLSADSLLSWNIQKDAAGALHVYHKGLDFVASTTNTFDGAWHHFALVMQRTGNLSAYIDGNLSNSVQATQFQEMGGANMFLGARGYKTGAIQNYDNHYNGKLDEFRLWNNARKVEQIKRDKRNRLLGDEFGLQAYVPFESYIVDISGIAILTPSALSYSANVKDSVVVTAQNGAALIAQTPTIKLPRPVQAVDFNFSINNDKIIITPTTDPALLENVTIDITVKDVKDLHGNVMQDSKTWIAYMNKNQVLWQDAALAFEKQVDSTIVFTTKIANTGGASKAFTIGGVPSWLQVSTTSGNIAPNSTQAVTFTIPAGGSIGEFNAAVTLTTDFGYDEVLLIDLKNKGIAPIWNVNPNNFQYSMSVFGQMKIDGVIASNPENKIAAFSNGVICGTANLSYVAAYDKYEVYLNLYSNNITGDTIKFSMYDASSGLTFVDVVPNIPFNENTIVGTPALPVTFVANTKIKMAIPLNQGWTWVSLPLQSNMLQSSNLLMTGVNATTNDIVKSNTAFDQYASSLGWLGNISSSTNKYLNAASYKVQVVNKDTIDLIGSRINPDSAIALVNVQNGWNWIGFVSTKNMAIAEAMGNYTAQTGDVLKSQYQFAYYDNALGWVGSLTHLKPGLGYMLSTTQNTSFTYPLSLFYGRKKASVDATETPTTQSTYTFVPEQYSKTMTVIAKGNICDANLENGNVLLGAFDNTNALRGYAKPQLNASTSVYNYYLTAYSNVDNEVLHFKYFDATNGQELSASNNITFVTDALQGTPNAPVEVNVAEDDKCTFATTTQVNAIKATIKNTDLTMTVSPNPFSDNLTINFNKLVDCKVELYDVLGKVLYSSVEKGKQQLKLNTNNNLDNIPAGVYYVRITGDNFIEQLKVIKIK